MKLSAFRQVAFLFESEEIAGKKIPKENQRYGYQFCKIEVPLHPAVQQVNDGIAQ